MPPQALAKAGAPGSRRQGRNCAPGRYRQYGLCCSGAWAQNAPCFICRAQGPLFFNKAFLCDFGPDGGVHLERQAIKADKPFRVVVVIEGAS